MLRLTGTVLVVDTGPLDLETYSDILGSLGHEVVPCASHQEAIRQLNSVLPVFETKADSSYRRLCY